MPIDFNTDIRLGPKYDGNWSFVHDFNQTFNMGIDDVSFTAALSAEASVALYFKAGVYLYSAAGPYLKIGPKLDAKVEGKAVTESGKPDKLVFETTGEFDMGGKVGAELKIAKWSLAKWETEFSLYNAKIWEYTKEVEKK